MSINQQKLGFLAIQGFRPVKDFEPGRRGIMKGNILNTKESQEFQRNLNPSQQNCFRPLLFPSGHPSISSGNFPHTCVHIMCVSVFQMLTNLTHLLAWVLGHMFRVSKNTNKFKRIRQNPKYAKNKKKKKIPQHHQIQNTLNVCRGFLMSPNCCLFVANDKHPTSDVCHLNCHFSHTLDSAWLHLPQQVCPQSQPLQ